MTEKRITLKDIADKCGVTPTLVSAVLNGRRKILCSPKRKVEIFNTARELGYRPNILARAMTGKSIPIVALLLHSDRNEINSALYALSYVQRCMIGMAFEFNNRNLEMLFIPYSTEEEQINRIDNLYKNSLIGAVVSNIIPNSHRKLCEYLKKSSLPYMILGFPELNDVYYAYPGHRHLFLKIEKLARERGLPKSALMTYHDGNFQFFRIPLLRDFIYLNKPVSYSEIKDEIDSTLVAVSGWMFDEQLKKCGITLPHSILVEQEESRSLLPADREILFVSDSSAQPLIEYTATHIKNWMDNGSCNQPYEKAFDDSPEDIQIRMPEQYGCPEKS